MILFVSNLCFIIRFDNARRYSGNTILRSRHSIAVGKREPFTRSVNDVLTGVRYKLTRSSSYYTRRGRGVIRGKTVVRPPTDGKGNGRRRIFGVGEMMGTWRRNKAIISGQHVRSVK